MDARSLIVLKHIFGIAAGLTAILAAWFELRDRAQTDANRAKTRSIYGHKWITIKNSGLLDLPERVIGWLLKISHVVPIKAAAKISMIPGNLFFLLIYLGVPLYISTAGWLRFELVGLLVLGGASVVCGWAPFLLIRTKIKLTEKPLNLLALAFAILTFAGTVIWLDISLRFHIAYALAIILAFLPVLVLFLGFSMVALGFVVEDTRRLLIHSDKWFFVGIATALSFSITLLSLLVGHLALPTSWIPKTIQMIMANVCCDGLTMYATLVILSLAVKPDGGLPIPMAIVLDIIVGALLACASLYLGLIFTSHALSITEVCRILVGLAPGGQHFEIGPYFWAMHTAFIPTLCYISLIFFCWLGKVFVLPIAALLSKGQYVEKPHHLTAGALLLLGAIFTALFLGLGALGELASSSPVSP